MSIFQKYKYGMIYNIDKYKMSFFASFRVSLSLLMKSIVFIFQKFQYALNQNNG